mgnify:CR=1 FL=1
MFIKRLKELSDKNELDKVYKSMDEKTKGAVKVLIEKLAVKMNDK